MRKRGTLALIILLLLSFMAGCMENNPDSLMKKPGYNEEQKQALQQIELDIPRGAIKEVRQVAISGQDPAEYVVIYKVPVKDAATPEVSGILVERYSPQTKSWSKAWGQNWKFRDLKFMGKAKLMGDNSEQVAVGGWSCNGGYFEFVLLGMKEGEIVALLNEIGDDAGIPNGGMKFEKDGITTFSGSQGTHYKWDGKKFITTALAVPPDMKDKKDGDLVLHYSFDDKENGKLIWPDQKPISMQVGQKLYLIRDNANGVWERIMGYGADSALESIAWSVFEAKHPGKAEISIIPNGYDWEKELKFEVQVNDK